jgi:Ni,Fe-hydrogenase I cytochrome b subunit
VSFLCLSIYLKIHTKRSKPFLSFAKTFNIIDGYIGFYHLKFVQVLYLILFSIVQKSVKKREERMLKKVLRKLKKESVEK